MIDSTERLQNHWLVAATSREIAQKPVARTVLEMPIVLFRSGPDVAAILDRCTHRNAPLSAGRIVDDSIECPYHGWRFGTDGTCVHRHGVIDAADIDCHNRAFDCRELNGLVWVRLKKHGLETVNEATSASEPDQESPTVTRWWSDPQFAHFTWSSHVEAEFADGIENLLDATHTPFVHAGLIRSAGTSQTFRAVVRVLENAVEAEYCDEGKQSGWISRIFERDRASSFGRFIPPCIAELEYTSRRGTEFVLNSHFTPETNRRLRVYSTFFVRRTRVPMFIKQILLTPFFRRVLKQDQHILRLQQQNIERFGGADFRHWEGDLLRGLIDHWIRTGELPANFSEQTVEINL